MRLMRKSDRERLAAEELAVASGATTAEGPCESPSGGRKGLTLGYADRGRAGREGAVCVSFLLSAESHRRLRLMAVGQGVTIAALVDSLVRQQSAA